MSSQFGIRDRLLLYAGVVTELLLITVQVLLLLICGQLASFTTAAGLVVALYKYFGWAGVKWLMGAAGAYMCLSCCVLAFARASQRQRMRGMSAVHM